MKKNTFIFSILAMLALFCAGGWYFISQNQTQAVKAEARKTFIQSSRPTIFFHGWGSSSRAERHMANAAKDDGVTKTIIDAKVDKDGRVTLDGSIPKGAINPIVLVNFDNNRGASTRDQGDYAYAVVKALQDNYEITEMNMVGHSYGNMAIVYYMLQHGSDTSLPKLVKQVDIAGHFNGIIGIDEPENISLNDEGKPSSLTESYQELLAVGDHYPQGQVEVLNIYGNTGNGSDERVTNLSSQSLDYLIKGHVKSYQEKEITGPNGQHSKLHETALVDKPLIDFLWSK
ncbi:alpha/beta hydrolase [Streptococcus salivarius]